MNQKILFTFEIRKISRPSVFLTSLSKFLLISVYTFIAAGARDAFPHTQTSRRTPSEPTLKWQRIETWNCGVGRGGTLPRFNMRRGSHDQRRERKVLFFFPSQTRCICSNGSRATAEQRECSRRARLQSIPPSASSGLTLNN